MEAGASVSAAKLIIEQLMNNTQPIAQSLLRNSLLHICLSPSSICASPIACRF